MQPETILPPPASGVPVLRIVIADDHALVREGLRATLEGMAGVQVVGEAADGRAALDLVSQLQPDVLLADIGMPEMNGLAVLRTLREAGSPVHVVLLTMYDSEDHVAEALRHGAAGYLVKNSALDDLDKALAAVRRGEIYTSASVADKVPGARAKERAALTARQRDVLRLVARGHSSKEAARVLGLSAMTVETHRAQIMERLHIRDLAGLVRYAIRIGLVEADE